MADLKKPNSYDALFPGRFLKAGLLDGKEWTLTVKDVALDEFDGDKGTEIKAILVFVETKMQLMLNRTNAECMREMFGKKVRENWVGKRVTFMPDTDRFGSDMVDCIRIAGSPDIRADFDASIQLRSKGGKIRVKKRSLRVTADPKQPKSARVDGPITAAAPAIDPDNDGREPESTPKT